MFDNKPLTQPFLITAIAEDAMLLTWQQEISPNQHQQILHLQAQITDKFANVVIDTVASYHCLMIYYRFDKITTDALQDAVKNIAANLAELESNLSRNDRTQSQCVNIPVYYDVDNNWDLQNVAQQCQLSIEQVIKIHSEQTYHAYALGFTPGFCYLAELAPSLHLPRKATPRLSVPKGAVAIAQQQTAVYPNASPGGWHIIGQTPKAMYQHTDEQFLPTISVGQKVKFYAISKIEYQQFVLAEHNRLSACSLNIQKEQVDD
jgi:KipI family sensor histidine kinase inhibitor